MENNTPEGQAALGENIHPHRARPPDRCDRGAGHGQIFTGEPDGPLLPQPPARREIPAGLGSSPWTRPARSPGGQSWATGCGYATFLATPGSSSVPWPPRGSLGGLATATAGFVMAMDAAGFDIILIETVGAGLAEVDIARLAHTTLVVEAPRAGR